MFFFYFFFFFFKQKTAYEITEGDWSSDVCSSDLETRAAEPKDPKSLVARPDQPEAKISTSWDQKTAAAYLDQRAAWWMAWPKAARDHETFCVSCHTAVPYAISRPALRRPLAEEAPSANERR